MFLWPDRKVSIVDSNFLYTDINLHIAKSIVEVGHSKLLCGYLIVEHTESKKLVTSSNYRVETAIYDVPNGLNDDLHRKYHLDITILEVYEGCRGVKSAIQENLHLTGL